MKKQHEFFFEAASLFCSKSGHNRFWHGSVLVYRNEIIGMGSNAGYKHAEVSSIQNRRFPKNKKFKSKLTVFVVRINTQGEYMNSKPCEKCQEYMRKHNISEAYYSEENGFGCMKF